MKQLTTVAITIAVFLSIGLNIVYYLHSEKEKELSKEFGIAIAENAYLQGLITAERNQNVDSTWTEISKNYVITLNEFYK
jgi:hypothetical protein